MKKALSFLLCCFCLFFMVHEGYAQHFILTNHRQSSKFKFKVVRQLVIVSLKINNKGPFNFVLDSGVGLLVITDPTLLDSIDFTDKRTVRLTGMGEGEEYEAYFTGPVKVDLPGITSVDVRSAILKKDHFNLTNYAGLPIHGLLGYEFFKELTVRFNFLDSTIKAYSPKINRKFSSYNHIPITIEHNKPFVQTKIRFCDSSVRKVRLLVDIGAGHALSLENMSTKLWQTSELIPANLGMGFAGPIKGNVGRVNALYLGKYALKDVITSFPNTVPKLIETQLRDGNIGLDVLSRFNIIFDYKHNLLHIKQIGVLRAPFEHDMSGLEYYAEGKKLRRVFISRVEEGSAAAAIGLKENDELLAVNTKPVNEMGLAEIDNLFRSRSGRNILLEILRKDKYEQIVITLKKRI